MIKSMTGYGRGESSDGARSVVVEIRAVNHRYGEFAVRLPRRYGFAEDDVKRVVRSAVKRGKADVSINVTGGAEDEAAVLVDPVAAKQYFKGLRELQRAFDISGDITLELLAGFPEVMRVSSEGMDEDSVLHTILDATMRAVRAFDGMRAAEGKVLVADLLKRADILDGLLAEIDARAPKLPAIHAEKLRERVEELLGAGLTGVAEERLAAEIAILADKGNITEEIVRLKSHIGQLRTILKGVADEPAGKKLDFLAQEMNREANTIGAKANDLSIAGYMLDMKSEIEKIREQVQNIE